MQYSIRKATATDKKAIAPFTTDTFDWGDYVQDRFDQWLADPASHNVVATLDGDPIGFARGVLPSPTELWLQGGRIHPDHRGNEVMDAMSTVIVDWAAHQGARVARALIEDWNTSSRRSIEKAAFREVSQWVYATREIINRDPQPTGNGGKRVRGDERLRPASSAETEPAFMAWSTSDLMRASRSLFAVNWVWRKLETDDLTLSAKEHSLFESASGWAIITRTVDQYMNVAWMMANPDDTFRLIRAVLDRAIETDAKGLHFFLPVLDETTAALNRIGCATKTMSIWEKSI